MKVAIGITGYPGSGKTTLIKKLIDFLLSWKVNLLGFYTEELREKGKRIGFDIVTIPERRRISLARIGNRPPKVGKYSVFTENLDEICRFLTERKFNGIYIIDELGKMELFSEQFVKFFEKVLKENFIVTYGLKLRHPLKDKLLSLSYLKRFEINLQNREELFFSIENYLIEIIPGL